MRTVILVIILAVVAPLVGQEAAAPASFLIERIEVRKARRVSPDVVIAESRLREGREYSEEELRDASTRLSRLPFLLNVDFALEKGSERGRHVLILTVNETRPFFYVLDLQPYFEDKPFVRADYRGDRGGSTESLALGARWFVGRRGAFHLGFEGGEVDREFAQDYASFSLGYTQYDLFGTRAFATLNLKKPVEPAANGAISPQLVVGVPVSANQTVTLQFDETRFESGARRVLGIDYPMHRAQRVLSSRWSYNTTDEPFFPTRGTLLHVTPMVGWTDGARVRSVVSRPGQGGADVHHTAYHSRFYAIEAGATRYFEITERDSVWGNVRGEWGRELYRDDVVRDQPETARYGSLGVGWAHSFWSSERREHGDHRIELTARYSNRTRSREEPLFLTFGQDVRQVGAAWLRRSSWGTLRLGAGYAW